MKAIWRSVSWGRLSYFSVPSLILGRMATMHKPSDLGITESVLNVAAD